MSRVQLTKEEAIAKIDQYLDTKFDEIVSEICDEFIATMNENAAAGRKQIKGKISLGYCGYLPSFAQYSTAVDRSVISQIIFQSIATDSIPYKKMVKYTNRWDLNYQEDEQSKEKVFHFAVRKSVFGFFVNTATYHKFVTEITNRLSRFEAKLTFKGVGLWKLEMSYRCAIPANYKPQPLSKESNLVAQKERAKAVLEKINQRSQGNPQIKVTTERADSATVDDIKEIGRRAMKQYTISFKPTIMWLTFVMFGVAPEDGIAELKAAIEQYNQKNKGRGFDLDLSEIDYYAPYQGRQELQITIATGYDKATDLEAEFDRLEKIGQAIFEDPEARAIIEMTDTW